MIASPKTVENIMSIANGTASPAKIISLRDRILSARPATMPVDVSDHLLGPIHVRRITLEDRIEIQQFFDKSKDGTREDKQAAMAMIAAVFLCDGMGDRPFNPDDADDIAMMMERVPAHVVDAVIEQGLVFNGMKADSGKAPSGPTPSSD